VENGGSEQSTSCRIGVDSMTEIPLQRLSGTSAQMVRRTRAVEEEGKSDEALAEIGFRQIEIERCDLREPGLQRRIGDGRGPRPVSS